MSKQSKPARFPRCPRCGYKHARKGVTCDQALARIQAEQTPRGALSLNEARQLTGACRRSER